MSLSNFARDGLIRCMLTTMALVMLGSLPVKSALAARPTIQGVVIFSSGVYGGIDAANYAQEVEDGINQTLHRSGLGVCAVGTKI